jgi:hypothetical protein
LEPSGLKDRRHLRASALALAMTVACGAVASCEGAGGGGGVDSGTPGDDAAPAIDAAPGDAAVGADTASGQAGDATVEDGFAPDADGGALDGSDSGGPIVCTQCAPGVLALPTVVSGQVGDQPPSFDQNVLGTPASIATDGAYVYWAERVPQQTCVGNAGQGAVACPRQCVIRRVPTGAGVPATFDSTRNLWIPTATFNPGGIQSPVMKAPLSGGAPVILTTLPAAGPTASDGLTLYVGEPGAGSIVRIPLDGGPMDSLGGGGLNPTGLALDSDRIFWTGGTLASDAIMTLPLAGTNAWLSVPNTPLSLSVDCSAASPPSSSFTIANPSSTTVTWTATALPSARTPSAPAPMTVSPSGSTLAPGESIEVVVTPVWPPDLIPEEGPSPTATIQISTNVVGAPAQVVPVDLGGIGAYPDLTFNRLCDPVDGGTCTPVTDPTAGERNGVLQFGTVASGEVRSWNIGYAYEPGELAGPTVLSRWSSTNPDFAAVDDGSGLATITFTPSGAGMETGTLTATAVGDGGGFCAPMQIPVAANVSPIADGGASD